MARVLVIDDEDLSRYAVRAILESAGHQVAEAENGAQALGILDSESFDLIVTDIVMPEKEGLETVRDVKAAFPGLPIIAMSGSGRTRNRDLIAEVIGLGADGALQKPFAAEALLEEVTRVLAAAARPD